MRSTGIVVRPRRPAPPPSPAPWEPLEPSLQFARHDGFDHPHALRTVVQARQVSEVLAAMVHEDLAVLAVEFLKGFQAIGGETRGDDGQALHAALRQSLHGL